MAGRSGKTCRASASAGRRRLRASTSRSTSRQPIRWPIVALVATSCPTCRWIPIRTSGTQGRSPLRSSWRSVPGNGAAGIRGSGNLDAGDRHGYRGWLRNPLYNGLRLMCGARWINRRDERDQPVLTLDRKPIYNPVIEFRDRASRDRFGDMIIAALRASNPGIVRRGGRAMSRGRAQRVGLALIKELLSFRGG